MKVPFRTLKDYKFLLNEIIAVPKFVNFFITSDCTCRCVMCNFWRQDKKYVTFAKFKECVDILADDFGFNNFSLTGGEPLLHPQYFTFINYIKERGFYANSPTNGTLLTEKNVRKLKESRIDSIGLSIDSLNPKIADDNRRHPNQLKKALNGLDLLNKYEIPCYAIVILAKHNIHEFCNMVRFFDEKYNTSTMLCFPDEGVGPLKEILFSKDEFLSFIDELLELKKQGYRIVNATKYLQELKNAYLGKPREIPCFGGYYVVNVYWNGTVKPCFNRKSFGDLTKIERFEKRKCNMCLNQCFIEQSYISESVAQRKFLTILKTQLSVFKMQMRL